MADLHPAVAADLGRMGVGYRVLECEPELADTAAFCAHYGIDPADSANTILVDSKRPPGVRAVCVVLSNTRLDVNHRVRELMGVRKVSFASAETTAQVTGMMVGGVTPFGLPADLPIYVDARVLERLRVVLGGGNRSSKLELDPSELTRLPNVTVVDGLAQPVG